MDAYQFMGQHPVLTFFLALIAANVAVWPFRLVNRWIRHRNVVAQGWPPFHLDADGDTRTLDGDDIEALKAGAARR
jgi:hypothetical protein